MSQQQLDNLLILLQTNRYMVAPAERQQAHADMIGDGELSLLIDDLRTLVDKIGVKAEEVGNTLRSTLETSEDLQPVIIYDENGRAS